MAFPATDALHLPPTVLSSPLAGALVVGGCLLLVAGLAADGVLLAWAARHRGQVLSRFREAARKPWPAADAVPVLAFVAMLNALMLAVAGGALAVRPAMGAGARAVLVFAQVALFHGAGLLAVAVSLRRRRLSWEQAFGPIRRTLGRQVLAGTVLYLGAMPWVGLSALAYRALLVRFGCPVEPQDVVTLLAGGGQSLAVRLMLMGTAVSLAPVAEEVLFRGVALPMLCRRVPAPAAALAVSLAFAAVHFHLPSFVPLLAIALAFSFGYLLTGSIVVPIVMHMLFNAVSILGVLVLRTAGGSG